MRPIDFYPLRPGANSEDSVFSGVPNGYKQDLIDNVTTAQAISACLLASAIPSPILTGKIRAKPHSARQSISTVSLITTP